MTIPASISILIFFQLSVWFRFFALVMAEPAAEPAPEGTLLPADDGGNVLEFLLPSGGTAFVVGTFHVLPQSAAQVSALVARKQPAIVAVELCSERIGGFREPTSAISDAVYNVELGRLRELLLGLDATRPFGPHSIRMHGEYAAASKYREYTPAWLLFRSEPGAEFRAGIRAAAAVGAEVVPIDRLQSITISRLTAFRLAQQYLPLLSAFKSDRTAFASLVSGGLARLDAAFPGPTAVAAKLLQGKHVSEDDFAAAINEFVDAARADPSFFFNEDLFTAPFPTAIGDERDLLLARAIKSQAAGPGQSVVAVVGAGHLKGIAAHWDSADSPASDALAASYEQRPPAWESVLLPVAGATVALTSLATGGGVAARGCWRLYRKLRGVPPRQTPGAGPQAPPRWRIRPGPAMGLLLVGGIGSALYSLSRTPAVATLPSATAAPPKPAAPLAKFQRLLRATTFIDPETGMWTCRARGGSATP